MDKPSIPYSPPASQEWLDHRADLVLKKIANYDASWSQQISGLTQCVASGMSTAEIIRQKERDAGKYQGFIPGWIEAQLRNFDLGDFVPVPPAPYRLAIVNGRYASLPEAPGLDALFDTIISCLDPDVDCLVEFGSGLGFNLASLSQRLPGAPFTYIACEPSEGGRKAAELIFSTIPSAKIETNYFDYTQPDLSYLSKFRKILAFTCHSIEQIPFLGTEFYRMLLATNVAACVHFEPIGWQRFTNIHKEILSIHADKEKWKKYRLGYNFIIRNENLPENNAIWSAMSFYNTDLLRLISDAADRGDILVRGYDFDIAGVNPLNPSTLLAWTRKR